MLHFLCSCSYLFTFLLSSEFYWHTRLNSTAYFFWPTLYIPDPRRKEESCCSSEREKERAATYRIMLRTLTARRVSLILYKGSRLAPKSACSLEWSRPPSNTSFSGPTKVCIPDGISVGSAVLTQLTIVTNRHRHTHGCQMIRFKKPDRTLRRRMCWGKENEEEIPPPQSTSRSGGALYSVDWSWAVHRSETKTILMHFVVKNRLWWREFY